jgi:hypothetical protein
MPGVWASTSNGTAGSGSAEHGWTYVLLEQAPLDHAFAHEIIIAVPDDLGACGGLEDSDDEDADRDAPRARATGNR